MLKRLLYNDYLLLFAVTMLVNAGNYGLNLFLGRFLGPVHFAEANVLATLVLMISFCGIAFQLTAAKFIAQSGNGENDLPATLVQASRRAGLILGLILLAISPLLSEYLKFTSVVPLILLFGAIPFYMVMSAERGILQGNLQFKRLGLTYFSEMVVRVLITTFLVFQFSKEAPGFLSHAIAVGFAASFIVSHFTTGIKSGLSIFEKIRLPEGLTGFFLMIMFYELCQIIMNNSDVILVKHFFENDSAGMYSALALIGRIVFFATWIMVTLLFPKIIQLKEAGKDTNRLFLMSLSGVAFIASSIVAGCYWKGPLIIELLFGAAYSGIGDLLWLYALATALFACANVFVYYYMSLGYYLPVAFSFIAGGAQIIGIVWMHGSLTQVIEIQLIVTASLLLSMVVLYCGQLKLNHITNILQQSVLYIKNHFNSYKNYPHETF